MRRGPSVKSFSRHTAWWSALFLLAAIPSPLFGLPNYTDPAGYPSAWPPQLAVQAYTRLGQPQRDVSGSISGSVDSSKGAAPQSSSDFSSGSLNNQPSFYYYGNGAILYFRVRLAGPPLALTGSSQPFDGVSWNFLLDIDGDGWKEFVIELDGDDGGGIQPDDLLVIYDNANSQRFTIGAANVWRQDAVRHPANRAGDNVNGEPDSSNAWDSNSDPFIWDFGRTRVTQLDTTKPAGSQNSEYFLDIQIPLSALDAAAIGGPTLTASSLFTFGATTSNSNTDPTQKDILYEGDLALGDIPLPGGDPTNPQSQIFQNPFIAAMTATACPSPITLTASVLDTLEVTSSSTRDTLSSVVFSSYYDANDDGAANDGYEWNSIGPASRTATLGQWSLSWNTTALPQGRYLIRATATDNQNNVTVSTSQPIFPTSVTALFNNSCGKPGVNLSGVVFEDVHYGGGAGRTLASSGGIARPGARVELFTAAGVFSFAQTTDNSGAFTFTNQPAGSNYTVRVVNSSVTSSRSGYVAGLLPVQTFRTTFANGATVPVTDRVGGENPALPDAPAAAANALLASLNTSLTVVQSLTSLSQPMNHVTGLNFGFNFDTIVNINDAGQGSLRQFILNANALDQASLAQAGYAAGRETAIFMLSDGAARPGMRAGLPNQLVNGTAIVQLASALPAITGPNTTIDGAVQSAVTGNVNGFSHESSTGPEVVLLGANGPVVTLAAAGIYLENLGLSRSTGSGDAGAGVLVSSAAAGSIIRNNTISSNAVSGVVLNGAAGIQIASNIIRHNGVNSAAGHGVELRGASNNALSENQVLSNPGYGIGLLATANNANTLAGNLVKNNGQPDDAFNAGIAIATGGNNLLLTNTVTGNAGDGVLISSGRLNTVTRNAISSNGGLGIDLGPGTEGDGITLNDANDADAGPNDWANFPVLESATIASGNLVLAGFARPGSTLEFFIAQADPGGFGEGQQFLAAFVEGSGEDSDSTSGAYGPGQINGVAQGEDSTTRFRFVLPLPAGVAVETLLTATATLGGSTSEFSGRATVRSAGYNVTGKVYQDLNRNGFVDGTETGTTLPLYAKLLSALTPAGPALQVATVDPVTGDYQFTQVAFGAYIIVLDNSADPADVTPNIPAGWVGTETPDQKRQNVLVNSVHLTAQNFGLLNSAPILGSVFKDTGISGGTANDGIRNGAEAGLANVKVELLDASGAVLDTTTTDGSGHYALFIPASVASGAALRVRETNPSSYRSTGGSAGANAGTYDRTSDTVSFTYAQGAAYRDFNFGDVPENQFLTDGQQAGLPGATLFYPHTFIAGTAGQVAFSTSSSPAPALPGWNHLLFLDSNCNAQIDAGEPQVTAPINVTAEQKVCLLIKHFIPGNASFNARDQIALTATFTYLNASPALTAASPRTDLTTVGNPATAGVTLLKSIDKNRAAPGDTVTYTITYANQSNEALSNVVIHDSTPAFTSFVSAGHGALPQSFTAVNIVKPAPGAKGPIQWIFTGVLAPGASGAVQFSISVD